MAHRPVSDISKRELHFIWLLDCSGSMAVDGKIQALNMAVREAIPHLRDVAATNPFARVLVRVVTFSDGAAWHVQSPVPVERFVWSDVVAPARGATDLGAALRLIAKEMAQPADGGRIFPPGFVLISDGRPTDDFSRSLRELLTVPEAAKAVRVAVAIGRDADTETLQEFMGRTDLRPLRADNPEMLVARLRFASTIAIESSASPRSSLARTVIEVPGLAAASESDSADEDVW